MEDPSRGLCHDQVPSEPLGCDPLREDILPGQGQPGTPTTHTHAGLIPVFE